MSDHPICHVEIPAIDPAAASRFYAEVFDWQMEVDPTRNYHMFEPQHGPGSAFVEVGETTGARIGEVLIQEGLLALLTVGKPSVVERTSPP